jgi:hypothetical protein
MRIQLLAAFLLLSTLNQLVCAATTMVIVGKPGVTVSVHLTNAISSEIIAELPVGEKVEVFDTQFGWTMIRLLDSRVGYVERFNLSPSPAAQLNPPNKPEYTASSERVNPAPLSDSSGSSLQETRVNTTSWVRCTNGLNELPMRKGVTDFTIIGRAPCGSLVLTKERGESYARIMKLDGQVGIVPLENLTSSAGSTESPLSSGKSDKPSYTASPENIMWPQTTQFGAEHPTMARVLDAISGAAAGIDPNGAFGQYYSRRLAEQQGTSWGASVQNNIPKLMLFGGPNHNTYLGCINCPDTATDSIFNEFGPKGSAFSTETIWNRFGIFQSMFSQYSACNSFASDPPIIVDSAGKAYGRLTVNENHRFLGIGNVYRGWLESAVCK